LEQHGAVTLKARYILGIPPGIEERALEALAKTLADQNKAKTAIPRFRVVILSTVTSRIPLPIWMVRGIR
jgi:hypothetical protein